MVRLQQVLVVLAGVAAAGVMVALGLWQLGVYQATGTRIAVDRAAAAPLPITEAAPVGAKVTDGLGRSVTFAGTYQADLQQLIPLAGDASRGRVLTAIKLDDGRLLAVVRGIAPVSSSPTPPTGRVEQTGVLLPSENADDPTTSVRVPVLAQRWPGQLVDGYVNLSDQSSTAQALQPSPLDLPEAPGRFRNGAYALQWWLFAGFALVLAGRIARDLDRGRDLELAAEADQASDGLSPIDARNATVDDHEGRSPVSDEEHTADAGRST